MIKSQPQKWLIAGIASLGLSYTGIAFGQASERGSPTDTSPGQPNLQSTSGLYQYIASYPRGRAAFPQGGQPLGGLGASPSPQYGSPVTPYGTIGQGAPGFVPGPSDQVAAPGAGIFGLASEQTGQAPPGTAPGARAPGELGPGAGPGGTEMGGAGAPGGPAAGAPVAAGAPGGPAAGAPVAAAGAAAGAAGLPEGVLAGLGGEVGAGGAAFAPPNMIGDRGPLFLRQELRFPPVPPPLPPPRPGNNPATLTGRSVAAIVPAIRGFKIADNQFPRPVDRVWVNFNYYDGVNSGINKEIGAPVRNMQVYHETFGLEKTFLDRQASIGFRIPLNTLTISSGFPGLGGTHTSTGNFTSFFKYVLLEDNRGDLLSGGLDMTFPTGPKSFAGYPTILGINAFELQPFLGYIYRWDRVYLQGFTSIAVPTDRKLATMYYFDVALGYFLYRSRDPRALLSAIVPTFETHLNIPLNWAGFQPRYIGSTPDVVDLTFGLNVGLASRAVLSTAYIRPVTGPTPFSGEFALMLNVFFGGRPGRNIPVTPPVIGQ